MSERLEVVITAQDGTAKVFTAIGRNAEQVGTSVEQAGKKGKAGMDQLGRSAEENAKRMERLKAEATALGAVMGVVGSAVIAAGAAYRDQARQVDGITRIYGEHADQILEMTEGIQDFTRYSNDAARESALIASSLATNYDMTAEQIDMLIQRSADLAQIYGIELPDAVQRTSAALRGEGESAEALGLNLSDAAIAARALDAGITNWNVPGALSEAEKAAFRFQLLMEDTQATVGAAADAADGAGGRFRGFINEIDDGVEAVGRFLGPVGEVAAEMAPIAMALPVVTAGAARMATTLRGSALAMGALGVAANPVTLALGAIAVGGGLAWASMREGEDASRRLEGALLSLGDTATNLRLSHLDEQAAMLDSFAQQVEFVEGTAAQYFNSRAMEAEANAIAAAEGREYADVLNELRAGYRFTADEANAFSTAQDKIRVAFADSRVDHDALSDTLSDLYDQYALNQITLDEYSDGVVAVAEDIDRFRIAQDAATESTVRATAAIAAMDEQYANTDEVLARLDERYAALAQRQEEWIAGMMAVSGIDDPLSQWNLSGSASDAAVLADNLTDVGTAADTAFRVIVGNTDAIKDQANAVLDWADALIGVQGEVSRLDELVNAGLITGTSGVFGDGSQYAMAQDAYNSIADSVLRIGDNLDAVQAIQAPLMADLLEDQAAYTDQLREMDAAQQLVSLAWMDSATAAKAMEIATMGASAAAGELGVNGEAAFEGFVTGAAKADPVLKALLIDMGIISEGADGTIRVHTEGLEETAATLEDINTTLGYVIDTLNGDALGTFSLKIDADVSQADTTVRNWTRDGYLGGWGEPTVPVDADVAPADTTVRNWAQDGYMGGWGEPTVPIEADTGAATSSLNAFEEQAAAPVSKTIDIVVNTASGIGGAVLGAAQSVTDALGSSGARFGIPESIDVAINGDASDLFAATEGARSELMAMPKEATVSILGDESAAMASIGAAGHNLATLDGSTATVFVEGDNSAAMAAIDDIQAYNGTVLATSYVDIVTRYSAIGSPTAAHGGVIEGYQSGGVVIEAGEVGAEIAHFPMGGTALLPRHGLYEVPHGTYISPHNAVGNNLGGVSIHFHGSFYGSNRQELDEWAEQSLLPTIGEVIDERWEGLITA